MVAVPDLRVQHYLSTFKMSHLIDCSISYMERALLTLNPLTESSLAK